MKGTVLPTLMVFAAYFLLLYAGVGLHAPLREKETA